MDVQILGILWSRNNWMSPLDNPEKYDKIHVHTNSLGLRAAW